MSLVLYIEQKAQLKDRLLLIIKVIIDLYKTELERHMNTHYLHSIIDQNQQLRLRVEKLSQIQGYMEPMLKKCDQLEIDRRDLQEQNALLYAENSSLKKQVARLGETHREQIRMVILEHDSIMRRMQEQLNTIRIQYKRESSERDRLKDNKSELESDLKQLQEKFKQFLKQTDREIYQLRQSLVISQKEYQALAQQKESIASESLTEKEQIMKQLYHLKAVVLRQMKRRIQQLQGQVTSLRKQTQGVKKYNQEIARNSALRQKQSTQQLRVLKAQKEQNQNLLNKQLRGLQAQLNQKSEQSFKRMNEINFHIDENIRLKRQLQLSLSNQDRLCFMLEESHKQNQNLRANFVEMDDFVREENQKYKQQFYGQRDHNTELRRVLGDKDALFNQKLRQIKDLLNIVDEIESALKVKDKQVQLYRSQLDAMEGQIKSQLKIIEERSVEFRTVDQKHRYLKVSMEQLQMLNASLKKQVLQLQTSNHSQKRQLMNPRNSNKQSQQKIQSIYQTFQKQKQNILQDHKAQKQKLRKTHQFEMKQKQLEFLRKIDYFQEQVRRLK